MLSAFASDHPVVILEHRSLYDTVGEVPEGMVKVPFGSANIIVEGTDVTIVAVSAMVQEALIAAEELTKYGISAEVVDPRTIRPLDENSILRSVRKTGHLVVVDTSWELCGFSSEVAALVAEKAFYDLKAPVKRLALANCPAPVSHPLESAFYPKASTIANVVLQLLGKENINLDFLNKESNFKGPY